MLDARTVSPEVLDSADSARFSWLSEGKLSFMFAAFWLELNEDVDDLVDGALVLPVLTDGSELADDEAEDGFGEPVWPAGDLSVSTGDGDNVAGASCGNIVVVVGLSASDGGCSLSDGRVNLIVKVNVEPLPGTLLAFIFPP